MLAVNATARPVPAPWREIKPAADLAAHGREDEDRRLRPILTSAEESSRPVLAGWVEIASRHVSAGRLDPSAAHSQGATPPHAATYCAEASTTSRVVADALPGPDAGSR